MTNPTRCPHCSNDYRACTCAPWSEPAASPLQCPTHKLVEPCKWCELDRFDDEMREKFTPAEPPSPECPECETGFPIKDGFHYGTQSLGMIPNTPCKRHPPAPAAREWIEAFRKWQRSEKNGRLPNAQEIASLIDAYAARKADHDEIAECWQTMKRLHDEVKAERDELAEKFERYVDNALSQQSRLRRELAEARAEVEEVRKAGQDIVNETLTFSESAQAASKRLRVERDRYKAALERISSLYVGNYREIASEALKQSQ